MSPAISPTHCLPSAPVLAGLSLSTVPASPSPDARLTWFCLPGWPSHGQTLKSWTLDCQHRTSIMHSAYRPPTGTSLTAVASIRTTSSASEGPRLAVHVTDHKPPAAGSQLQEPSAAFGPWHQSLQIGVARSHRERAGRCLGSQLVTPGLCSETRFDSCTQCVEWGVGLASWPLSWSQCPLLLWVSGR